MTLYSAVENKNCYISFNQDYSCFGVAYESGFMFYKTVNVLENDEKPLDFIGETKNSQLDVKNCRIVERLFSTGLLMVVTRSNRRAVQVYRMTTRELITHHQFPKTIIAVKVNRNRLLVLLEDSMHIYDLVTMKSVHTFNNLPLNSKGVLDMSTADGTSLIAFPESKETGIVEVFNAIQLIPIVSFIAHQSKLACVKFNPQGTMLATASERGSVIRVFSIPSGMMTHEFRRGVLRFVNISSMSFSEDSKFLCSASNTETVHVYKLEKEENPSSYWMETLKSVREYMPPTVQHVSNLITGERSFAIARLPCAATKAQVSITNFQGERFVIVVTLEGQVYAYRLLNDGGDIPLIIQHRIGAEPEPYRFIAVDSHMSELNELVV